MSRKHGYGGLTAAVAVLGAGLPVCAETTQATRIPAAPPITGPFWTIVLPLVLFAVSFFSAYALYRHFAGDGDTR